MNYTLKHFLTLALFFITLTGIAQVKVSGKVVDSSNQPIPYANVYFPNTTIGTITDEEGRFYMEDANSHNQLTVSFLGYEANTIPINSGANYKLVITLQEVTSSLGEVMIVSGKQSKKNNPAIDILRKIWKNKRKNGVKLFDQYEYRKYEKIEFDLNNIDSTLVENKVFKDMEFIFDYMDTSRISGKTYLPIFLNEAVSSVYGDNTLSKEKSELLGNKNSGFSDNQSLIAFIKDMYNDYDIYDNYIKLYEKSFTSPLSQTGINVYNYALIDSAYIKNKWCYNIVYYPRRKNELTFKGDFWVNDTTWAIKDINMEVSKSANINWVKELYIEQEFDVLNDSIFLITRDFFQSDFTLRKKESSKGMYGKRTSLYDNYKFDEKRDPKFFKKEVNPTNFDAYHREPKFWEENRLEKLNKDESQVYAMLDTLKTVQRFKNIYKITEALSTGYYGFKGFDYGPIFSTVGANEIEGFRLRVGARTYFSPNDLWRIQGYTAYGFSDNKFKYSIAGKVLLDRKTRLKLIVGNRRDIEQLGASLTNTNDVEGRSFASNSLFSVGDNESLTNINLTSLNIELEPVKNLVVSFGGSFRTLKAADPKLFSLAYFTDNTFTETKDQIKQFEISTKLTYTPGKKTSGYGVDRLLINSNYPEFFLEFTQGLEGPIQSDFNYYRAQLFYRQPFNIGGLGKTRATIELGKTFGTVPLGLLSVVPGNQSYFSIYNTFPMLNFYEFVTDSYSSLHVEHNFGGRLLSRVPLLRKLNLREIITVRGVIGTLSDENIEIDASSEFLSKESAPHTTPYYEYSFGIGNIFKVARIDFNFRGNYKNVPDARTFGVTGSFGFFF